MPRTALGREDRKLLREAEYIIGIDEVGRGCLAGPVVVCGVSFAKIPPNPHVRDSKVVPAGQREQVAAWIRENCQAWLLVEVWVELIDRINILESTRLAVQTILRTLSSPRAIAVVDHVDPGEMDCPVRAVPRADARYFSVAAASLVAKVHRDRMMADLTPRYPEWTWCDNKGYGTRKHRQALEKHGTTVLHRKSFEWSPVLP
jgi:ribonuclease HII